MAGVVIPSWSHLHYQPSYLENKGFFWKVGNLSEKYCNLFKRDNNNPHYNVYKWQDRNIALLRDVEPQNTSFPIKALKTMAKIPLAVFLPFALIVNYIFRKTAHIQFSYNILLNFLGEIDPTTSMILAKGRGLKHIPEQIKWCKNVTICNFSFNELKTIPDLSSLPIEFLDLTANRISSINTLINSLPEKLRILHINDNPLKLRQKEIDQLLAIPSLKKIHISEDQLAKGIQILKNGTPNYSRHTEDKPDDQQNNKSPQIIVDTPQKIKQIHQGIPKNPSNCDAQILWDELNIQDQECLLQRLDFLTEEMRASLPETPCPTDPSPQEKEPITIDQILLVVEEESSSWDIHNNITGVISLSLIEKIYQKHPLLNEIIISQDQLPYPRKPRTSRLSTLEGLHTFIVSGKLKLVEKTI